MTLQLRHETPDDIAAIEAVTIAAFADAPHTSHTEQFIVRALRDANELTLSLVAEEQGQVVGHVALSPVTITDRHGHKAEGWYGLGPISVLPQRQGQGIGAHLMEQALAELRDMQAAGCVLLGEPAYYARFGFQAHAGLQLPGVPPGYIHGTGLRWACARRHRALQRCLQCRRLSASEGGGVMFGFNTGRGHRRARIFEFTAPRPERLGRGADDGYSFVSMIHHTARCISRPVMG